MKWETIIGLTGAVLTTISYLPQALKSIKNRSTGDISLLMYIILNAGILMWLLYGIAIRDLPVICANGITIVLTGIILFLKIKYK